MRLKKLQNRQDAMSQMSRRGARSEERRCKI
ncbi:hypothetical protein [Flavonifractor phage Cormatin]|nr:hypothetical protein [Flavonifractor phage Cormatin]DAH66409.1 MAG TPA: hypothetical protein [Caudoviricetes sp.]